MKDKYKIEMAGGVDKQLVMKISTFTKDEVIEAKVILPLIYN